MLPRSVALRDARGVPLVPVALACGAMVAFAANSILCRLALDGRTIDAYAFTAVRVGAGALALSLLSLRRPRSPSADSWTRAGYLVLYALPFSLAYVALDAGTGALLLFGAVQLTMIVLGIRRGERPGPRGRSRYDLRGPAGTCRTARPAYADHCPCLLEYRLLP